MCAHVCPWWGGYFIDNRLRRWLHDPDRILAPYVKPGMTVLDFGCGMGMFAIAMAKLVGKEGRVLAVDLQQKMLDVLVERATKAGVASRIHVHRCEADALALRVLVDFVLAFYSAHEVANVERLLAEVRDCLRPEGKFLLVEPKGHVTASDFETVVSQAGEIGLQEQDRPRIRFSRATLLVCRQRR